MTWHDTRLIAVFICKMCKITNEVEPKGDFVLTLELDRVCQLFLYVKDDKQF